MALPSFIADAEILSQSRLGKDVYAMALACADIAAQARPGMFAQVQVRHAGLLLRRPISIADADGELGQVTLIYRVVGKGTAAMAEKKAGERLNLLAPLGHGFRMEANRPLLVGGGMGIAPLLFLAKEFHGRADVLIGGRSREEMFWPPMFAKHAKEIFVTTDDGSMGEKGFTVDFLPTLLREKGYDAILCCGPEIMMRGIARLADEHHIPCQVSLERHMACGLGACLSCSVDIAGGKRKKVCKDGPVFPAEEVFA